MPTVPLNSLNKTSLTVAAKRLSKSMRRRLASGLPWIAAIGAKKRQSPSKYKSLEADNNNREESAENALNEALEARFLELIASAPVQDGLATLQLGMAPDLFDLVASLRCDHSLCV
jgi:hypothetical protein